MRLKDFPEDHTYGRNM